MCWMQVKPQGKKINREYMDKAQIHNDDGYGVAWYEDDMVKTYKTFDYKVFCSVLKALEDFTLVIHLRYTTKGSNSYSNLHPFDTGNGYMFHNGTMFGLDTVGTMSDSATLADTLFNCEYDKVADIEPLIRPYIDDKINRLVFFEDSGEITIMNKDLGMVEDGVWYSNDYHKKDKGWCRTTTKKTPSTPYQNSLWTYAKGKDLKDIGSRQPEATYYVKKSDVKDKETMQLVKPRLKTSKVFVYGTLKRGQSNHQAFLKDAVFLGKATTNTRWTMGGKGQAFPYVYEENEKFGANIVGEVFAVDSKELAQLDRLEGVPTHYRRNKIEVDYSDDGTTEEVIMYSKTYFKTDYHKDQEMITEWSA